MSKQEACYKAIDTVMASNDFGGSQLTGAELREIVIIVRNFYMEHA